MFAHKTVSVVVPAYNEENFISSTLAVIPAFVDDVIVVDDFSRDDTVERVRQVGDRRIRVVRHTTNQGVGGAILTGYREALAYGSDVAVVMAGDGQMDPEDLPALLEPIAQGEADYVKGNRFIHPHTYRCMPRVRLLGNVGLSLLTSVASGYWNILDSQCGYTAVTAAALRRLAFDAIYPRYGFPNDFLAHLHSAGARVAQVRVRPIYDGQDSGIRPLASVPSLSYVLARSWVHRLARELL
jgi:glycosyltransferase involved in cell wall biosynthesis